MRLRRDSTMLFLAGVLASAAGCVDATGPGDALRDLAAARRRWQDSGYTDYRYRLQVLCYCGDVTRPVDVTVFRGTIGVWYVDTGEPADTLWFGRYATIERLFATIAEAAANGGAVLRAEYDGALGYPRQVSLDPVPNAIDDELSFTVSDVVPLRVR